jgi:hypothetical protein
MKESEALGPLEFRFLDPEDQAQFGDRWYRYSEADLIRMRARDLMALEAEMNTPVLGVMNGVRNSTTLGDLAAAWLGVRAVDPALAGPFAEFNPLSLAIDWRSSQDPRDVAPAPVEPGKEETPPEQADPEYIQARMREQEILTGQVEQPVAGHYHSSRTYQKSTSDQRATVALPSWLPGE